MTESESSGTSAMFDDYCDTLSLLTKYADKPTLKDRVQAVLDEVERLSQRREDRHEEALDCLEESGTEIRQLQAEVERLQRSEKAVKYADELGICAVPINHGKVRYWRLRLQNGYDAPLTWLLKNEPNHSGWLSWEDAVIALGDALEKGEVIL